MRALLEVVFPYACLSCGAPGHPFLCDDCVRAFPFVDACCERCGRPTPMPARACSDCRDLRPAFAVARAAAAYTGVARDALMTFKLGGERRAARHLAAAMSGPARAAASVVRAGTVVFVPATRAAVSERGFNTAEELARPLGRTLGLPVRRLLRKTRDTADQAGLGRDERALNLRGAFSSGTVEGGVVLVDDVLTTGATADACARALLDAGAEGVGVVTFARAP